MSKSDVQIIIEPILFFFANKFDLIFCRKKDIYIETKHFQSTSIWS